MAYVVAFVPGHEGDGAAKRSVEAGDFFWSGRGEGIWCCGFESCCEGGFDVLPGGGQLVRSWVVLGLEPRSPRARDRGHPALLLPHFASRRLGGGLRRKLSHPLAMKLPMDGARSIVVWVDVNRRG